MDKELLSNECIRLSKHFINNFYKHDIEKFYVGWCF